AIRATGAPTQPNLDVEWEAAKTPAPDGSWVPETRPGHEGHAGIRYLDKGNKTQREDVRWQLAEMAAVRILTDDEVTAFGRPTEAGPATPSPP
ncbi:MAG TPA: hypothetical protein VH092_32005, partial [Urbifossiella sp.]|nr:hypothetical protein [Urbifossiella sp.]